MKTYQIATLFSLLPVLAMLGCDGNGVSADPLAGDWSSDACFGSSSMPADVESCSVALAFTSELDVQLDATWISLAATETNPGCTTTRTVTGQEWSTDHATNTVTLTGEGAATISRTNCVKAEDNLAATATSDIKLPSGDAKYEINSDTLTILSGALKGTYDR
jgi:hypothetical protein